GRPLKTCPRAYKKLDRPGPRFEQYAQKLFACARRNFDTRVQRARETLSPALPRVPASTIARYVAAISSSTSGGGGSRRSRCGLTAASGAPASTKAERWRF